MYNWVVARSSQVAARCCKPNEKVGSTKELCRTGAALVPRLGTSISISGPCRKGSFAARRRGYTYHSNLASHWHPVEHEVAGSRKENEPSADRRTGGLCCERLTAGTGVVNGAPLGTGRRGAGGRG